MSPAAARERQRTFGARALGQVAAAALFGALLLPLGRAAVAQEWQGALDAIRLQTKEREALQAAYTARGGLLWMQAGLPGSQALALVATLAHADELGLSPADYGASELAAQLSSAESLDAKHRAALDLQLSRAALLLIGDLARGRIDPLAVHWQLGRERPDPPLAPLLVALSSASDLPALFESLEPPFPLYRRTAAALRAWRALEARGEGPALAPWKQVIEAGDSPAGLDALVARLTLLGDLPAGEPPHARYEGALVIAVQAFQLRHGLKPDGRIDRRTQQALAVPLAARALQLELTLERMRWLPRDLAPPLLAVNIPEFRLRALSPPGERSLSMRVVVGRAYHHKTPVFLGAVEAVQIHPYWDVPADIAVGELLPKFAAKGGLPEGFELVDASGIAHAVALDAALVDQVRAGALRLRQRPGPTNSLGLIKLVMPNPFEVYLHGTPAPERFASARRDFSHGCIRVEEPQALATWALAGTPGWDEDRVRAALGADESVRVELKSPLRVVIVYATSVVAEDGRVSFFDDVYGNDALLEKALTRLSRARRARLASPAREPRASRAGSVARASELR